MKDFKNRKIKKNKMKSIISKYQTNKKSYKNYLYEGILFCSIF
jgi:hypothetical protein